MNGKSAMKFPTRIFVALLSFACLDSLGAETNVFKSSTDLKKLSLEELMDLEVSLVTRTPEKLSESASAAQVVSGEDIRRSGATSIPEALRLAPNLHVAQANSSQWAISARGFNQPGLLANKLLVMIDGRTVYTPLFAGVFWDVQSTLLEDIDRIEVVSGPGGTLWGGNAVNGVINVVSKSAEETQGLYVSGAVGTFLQDFGGVRYGGSAGTNVFYRVYGQRFDRNSTVLRNGNEATNAWDFTQGGFRMDWLPAQGDRVTLQGDAYAGTEETPTADTTVDGQNVLARWTHTFPNQSDFTLQTYFDRTWRRIPGTFSEDLKTYDIDAQHRFGLGERQSITWGAGYRIQDDSVDNSPALAFFPPDDTFDVVSGFVQDEVSIVPDQLKLTIGTKLEHNDFSGFEIQPSVRLAWIPNAHHTLWGAISRAVRTPSRIDQDFFVPGTPPFLVAGGTNFTSEKVIAYEIGYRVRPTQKLSLSLATFFNQYDDLRSAETNGTSLVVGNGLESQSWGAEFSGEFRATEWWRMRGGYTYFDKNVWEKPGHNDVNLTRAEGNDPRHQFMVQSMMSFPHGIEFDLTGRFVDDLPSPHVPSYFTLDVRAAWRPTPHVEFSVVGQNLVDSRHPEFVTSGTRQEIPRSVYGKVTLWF
jgi:iron complex outermembrane recepter protein